MSSSRPRRAGSSENPGPDPLESVLRQKRRCRRCGGTMKGERAGVSLWARGRGRSGHSGFTVPFICTGCGHEVEIQRPAFVYWLPAVASAALAAPCFFMVAMCLEQPCPGVVFGAIGLFFSFGAVRIGLHAAEPLRCPPLPE